MISITPFGQTGPYAEWKAYDLNAYHLTASGSRYCGRPGEPPLEHGTFSAEFFGAYTVAAWGLAAVHGRERAGGSQHLDVSCAEALAALFVGCQNIGAYAQDGVSGQRTGVGMPLGAPATILPCKDGHVWMMALEPGQWDGLSRAMGDPEWARLEMFQDMFVRAENAEAIYPLIEQWTMERTKQEIMDLCQANGCPTTALFTIDEVARHPHLEEKGYFVNLDHPVLGTVRTMSAPIRLPESPGGPRKAAPLLAEHNAEILDVTADIEVREVTEPVQAHALPLEGVRVANFGWGWLGPVAGPMSNRHPLTAAAPHGVFPCAGDDRWISIAVVTDEEWQNLVRAMGDPPWAQAAGFATTPGRVARIEILHEKLSEWTRGFDDY